MTSTHAHLPPVVSPWYKPPLSPASRPPPLFPFGTPVEPLRLSVTSLPRSITADEGPSRGRTARPSPLPMRKPARCSVLVGNVAPFPAYSLRLVSRYPSLARHPAYSRMGAKPTSNACCRLHVCPPVVTCPHVRVERARRGGPHPHLCAL